MLELFILGVDVIANFATIIASVVVVQTLW